MAAAATNREVTWDAFLDPRVDAGRVALAIREDGRWHGMRYAELRKQVERLSSHLTAYGVVPGDRVAILAEGRPEWAVALFASFRSGAVAVPLDAKLTVPELAQQMSVCQPRVLLTSVAAADTARQLATAAPGAPALLVLNGGSPPSQPFDRLRAGSSPARREGVISPPSQPLDRLSAPHSPARGEGPSSDQFERSTPTWEGASPSLKYLDAPLVPAVLREDGETALITFTSGTTGEPRGVMTTFDNLLFQVEACVPLFGLSPRDVSLSVLSPNHLFELTCGLLSILRSGGQVCYLGSLYPSDVADATRERRVTRMAVVPLFLRLLQRHLERSVDRKGPLGRAAFALAMRIADCLPTWVRRKVLFGELHRELGPALSDFMCGGAALDPALARDFQRLGFSVYQGYGLTETSPVISCNAPGRNRLGSVGRPIPGVEVSIEGDSSVPGEGEILTRGPHVMRGYYQDDEHTRDAINKNGWFHTGDLGRVDGDGYLYVTGRLKDLIVLGGGKKVSPDEVETHLRRSPAFREACVVGRSAADGITGGTEEVWAVVVPDAEALGALADARPERARPAVPFPDQWARREVERAVGDLAPYKRPRHIVVRWDDLPMTPTRKLRRHLVRQWLDEQVSTP